MPRYGAMADINMTPFIDVMLVLLIIFMVAAPLLTSGVAVDLPQAKAGALNVEQKPVAIVIDEKGQVYLMDRAHRRRRFHRPARRHRQRWAGRAPLRSRVEDSAVWTCRCDHGERNQRRIQESRARHRTRHAMKGRPA